MRRNMYGSFFPFLCARSVKLRVCFYFFFFSCYTTLLDFFDLIKVLISPSALKHTILSSVFAHTHNSRTRFCPVQLSYFTLLLKIFFSQFLRTEQSVSSAGHTELSNNDFLSKGGHIYAGLLLNARQR